MADQRVPTTPQHVRVFLRGGILAEGDAHVRAGAYRQRVSDLLNLQSAPFLPLTDVRYQAPGTPATHTDALLVHIPDIVAVDLGVDDRSAVVEEPVAPAAQPAPVPPPPGSSI